MIGRFNANFGIPVDLAAERGRFVQRINQTAFSRIQELTYPIAYRTIFENVCYRLGINAEDRIEEVNGNTYFETSENVPPLRSLTREDFMETLRVLVLLHEALGEEPEQQEALDRAIAIALHNATIDIEVRWHDGMFYPAGAKELDERLIEEPLRWLGNFPDEKADYLKALAAYEARRFDEVIGNCYLVIEGVARSILKNTRTLDNNREELLRMIGLSQEWKALLSNFINYANEFKRHASEKRHAINPIESEGFLYMTGLLVRMIVEATKRPAAAAAPGTAAPFRP